MHNTFSTKKPFGMLSMLFMGFTVLSSGCNQPLPNGNPNNTVSVAQRQQKGGGGGGCGGYAQLRCRNNADSYCEATSYWETTGATIYTCDTFGLTLADNCQFDLPIDPGQIAVTEFSHNPFVTINLVPSVTAPGLSDVWFEVTP